MLRFTLFLVLGLSLPLLVQAQIIEDDFEGNGNITNWFGDDCYINIGTANPFITTANNSATVMAYSDDGGQYANVRFEMDTPFPIAVSGTFSLKIYVPSTGITGNQPHQVSLKLQDGNLPEPWSTQTEIIKPIVLDQWQTLSFNFVSDNYINLNGGSPPPIQRSDLNRLVIQVNGENNNDQVIAYIDDFYYDATLEPGPVFDQLVWSDEFDTDGALDATKWFHQTQLPEGGSWFNGEIQHYTDRTDNSYVQDGIMYLVAKRENFTDQGHTKSFTSARLNSKFAFTYGRVEVRAKLPTGVGTWPAIWMLGKNISESGAYWQTQGFGTTGWPACGEIDIMEHWGNNQNFVQSAMHTPSSFGATENHGGQTIGTVSSAFHVYEMEWTAEKIVFSVDGHIHYIYDPEVKNASTWPFDADQYMLLNIAIQPSIAASFSASDMEVDYVRVYQESSVSTEELIEEKSADYFPNPVDSVLNIELAEETTETLTFDVYNLAGKLLKSYQERPVNQLIQLKNMDNMAKGVYIVSYELNGKPYSFKMIKS
ncbi:MAG: family 16 glycosylhydrolase [Bacteroidota bacterium]